MKYCVILLTVMLTGCGQYVADTKLLSEKMAKCESIGMDSILYFSDNSSGRVGVKCTEKRSKQ